MRISRKSKTLFTSLIVVEMLHMHLSYIGLRLRLLRLVPVFVHSDERVDISKGNCHGQGLTFPERGCPQDLRTAFVEILEVNPGPGELRQGGQLGLPLVLWSYTLLG